MPQKTTLLAFLTLLLCVTTLPAQSDRAVVNQGIEWFSIGTSLKLHKKISWYIEGQGRFAQDLEPMQFQARTALDYEINKKWSVYPIGYVYTWNPLYGKQPNTYVNNEHRFFEQVMYKHKIARASVSHRLRLEQRLIQVHTSENGEVVDQGYDYYANRLRYRFNANIPFKNGPIAPGSFYGVVYDEIFLSFGKSVTYQEPDQNRIFVGLAYAFTSKFSLQGGPFYQMLVKAGGAKQENNIGVQVHATLNLDLSKGE